MQKIAIIGGGIMARGMAMNFLLAGYSVTIWNRTQANVAGLIDRGAIWAETPKLASEGADIIIECVTDDAASRQVWTNTETGILAASNMDAVHIAASSLSLEWTDELAQLCANDERKFMDMPLTGSRAGAESGNLRLLIGADIDVLDSVRDSLNVIAEKVYHFGPIGSGMRFKLILNGLMGIHVNAAAQSIVMAERAGLDPEAVRFALFDGNMGPASPITNGTFQNRNQPDDYVNFAIQWIEKDLRYAQAMAKQNNVDFDLLNDTQADYAQAVESGMGELDLVKIYQMHKEKAVKAS